MITPGLKVEIDDRRLVLHLDQLPMALKTNLRETVTSLTQDLLARVRAAEPMRTGELRYLTRGFVDEKPDSIRGRVRILAPPGQTQNIAAAALEYGAHRSVSVRAAQREGIAVRAYQRHANIAAQRFLRGPAEAIREHALEELQKAVGAAVKGPAG